MNIDLNNYVFIQAINGWLPCTDKDITPYYLTEDKEVMECSREEAFRNFETLTLNNKTLYAARLGINNKYGHLKTPLKFSVMDVNGSQYPIIEAESLKIPNQTECPTVYKTVNGFLVVCEPFKEGSNVKALRISRWPKAEEIKQDADGYRVWEILPNEEIINARRVLRELTKEEPELGETLDQAYAVSLKANILELDGGLIITKGFTIEDYSFDPVIAVLEKGGDETTFNEVKALFVKLSKETPSLFVRESTKGIFLIASYRRDAKYFIFEEIINVRTALMALLEHFGDKEEYDYITNNDMTLTALSCLKCEPFTDITDLETQLRDTIKGHTYQSAIDGFSNFTVVEQHSICVMQFGTGLLMHRVIVDKEYNRFSVGRSLATETSMPFECKPKTLSEFERHALRREIRKCLNSGDHYSKNVDISIGDAMECFIGIVKGN